MSCAQTPGDVAGCGNLFAVKECSATILNRTMIGYAYIQLILLLEKEFYKAK